MDLTATTWIVAIGGILIMGLLATAQLIAVPPIPRTQSMRSIVRALIVSDDRLHHPNLRMVIVVPGTSTIRPVPLHVVVEPDEDTGLAVPTVFQAEQVRAMSIALRNALGL